VNLQPKEKVGANAIAPIEILKYAWVYVKFCGSIMRIVFKSKTTRND
jgi:hypothetical protein